jgi:4-hydroxy-tetrahydrodipicolinate synthase
MSKPVFAGAMTALVTPFFNGKVDETRLRQQIAFQIRGGIDGLVPVGTTGESPTLDFPEHKRVIDLTVQAAVGRIPVIAGTGGNATAEAMELHAFAKEAGASASLSVNPYYNKPSQEGLYRHFMTLADRVDLPIVLYNIPGRTGISMTPHTVQRLFAHPNIVAIKEASGSLDMCSEIMSLCTIPILSGDDSLTVPMMSIGAVGVISVLANLAPAKVKAITTACREGRFNDAAKLHHAVFGLTKSLFLDGNPVGIKYAMKVAGLDSGELRLPLCEANQSAQKAIEHFMKESGAPFAT